MVDAFIDVPVSAIFLLFQNCYTSLTNVYSSNYYFPFFTSFSYALVIFPHLFQGFQFRALQRVRIFNEPDAILYDSICPSWITVSSRYGIIVCASGYGKLISLRTSDVHRLNTIKTDINVEVTDIQTKITNLQVEQVNLCPQLFT